MFSLASVSLLPPSILPFALAQHAAVTLEVQDWVQPAVWSDVQGSPERRRTSSLLHRGWWGWGTAGAGGVSPVQAAPTITRTTTIIRRTIGALSCALKVSNSRLDLAEHPHDLPPRIRIHRQHVDDDGPVVAPLVAVAEQLRGDRVTVVLVVDQDAAEGVAGESVEHLENGSELRIVQPIPLSSSMQTAPFQTMPGEHDGGGDCVGFEVAT